jgi:hypothetical protein
VLRHLDQAGTRPALRIASSLTMRWGDPVGWVRRIERAMPLLADQKVEALQDGLDELRGVRLADVHNAGRTNRRARAPPARFRGHER